MHAPRACRPLAARAVTWRFRRGRRRREALGDGLTLPRCRFGVPGARRRRARREEPPARGLRCEPGGGTGGGGDGAPGRPAHPGGRGRGDAAGRAGRAGAGAGAGLAVHVRGGRRQPRPAAGPRGRGRHPPRAARRARGAARAPRGRGGESGGGAGGGRREPRARPGAAAGGAGLAPGAHRARCRRGGGGRFPRPHHDPPQVPQRHRGGGGGAARGHRGDPQEQILPGPGEPDEAHLPRAAAAGPGAHAALAPHHRQLCHPLPPLPGGRRGRPRPARARPRRPGAAAGRGHADGAHGHGGAGAGLVFPHQLPAALLGPGHRVADRCHRAGHLPGLRRVRARGVRHGGVPVPALLPDFAPQKGAVPPLPGCGEWGSAGRGRGFSPRTF